MNRPARQFARMLARLLALATLAILTPAQAQDPRLVERFYDPGVVVPLAGRTKVQATIMFADDERIENVAIGDSTAWQVTPNKRANLLFVKPLDATARTNMTVITDRRTYLFDLIADPRARPVYMLSFRYPVDPVAEAEAEAAVVERQVASAEELAAAADPYAVVDPALLNFAWSREGDAELLPLRIYDDGGATFLQWQPGVAMPAILVRDEDGTEGPVNFVVRDDTIVVDGVPPAIILRAGEREALLTFAGPMRPLRAARPERAPGTAFPEGF